MLFVVGRYVKFDSTGDKLITAIALSSNLLSQFDSISLREVFHYTRERAMLEDFRLIEKHCERQSLVIKNFKNEERKVRPFGLYYLTWNCVQVER